LRGEIDTLVN